MQSNRAIQIFLLLQLKRLFPLITILVVIISLVYTVQPAQAAVTLSIQPLTWNVVGLDSNDVTVGPNNFPVGVRVCNTGAMGETAQNVTAQLVWDSSNPYIALRTGSLGYVDHNTTSAIAVPDLPGGNVAASCRDIYFEVTLSRNPLAYDTNRRYHIVVDSTQTTPISTTTPRELYVEHLISQSRNSTTNVLLDGVSIPAGGTMALVKGNTYEITLVGSTATNGYEQIENFINFPNTIFQINRVTTTYMANDTLSPDPNAGNKLYADGCNWENDPTSPNYRSCLGVGKYGGNVTVVYNVTILSTAPTGSQTLTNLIYDFSGSSYHYNADFTVGARIATIIDPTSVTIAKSFTPSTTQVNGTSTLNFTINNPNGAALSDLHFTDTFPTSPGVMVTSGTSYTTTGCGTPTVRAPVGGGGYASGVPSVSVSNITIAANGSCTISLPVSVPVAGPPTYDNTTSHLFIGLVDTTRTASASLTVSTTPPPPPCTPGIVLASWDMNTSLTPTYQRTGVNATATHAGGLSSEVPFTLKGQTGWSLQSSKPNYWPQFAGGGYPNNGTAPYFQFEVNSGEFTDLQITFDATIDGNWANKSDNHLYVWSNFNDETYDADARLDYPNITPTDATWYTGLTASASHTTTATSIGFRINEIGAKSTGTMPRVVLDNVVITGCGLPDHPTIAKSFSPDPVAVGAASTLTFAINNPNPYAALSGIDFSDTLPAGLTVATSGPTATCGGTLSTTAPSIITFTGGTLAAGASCTLAGITVTATTAGPHVNVSGNISSTQTGTNYGPGGTATDTLTAILPPAIDKSFTPTSIPVGGTSTLTFVITNPNTDHALSGVAFTDLLPLNVTDSGPVTTPQCNGGALAVTTVGGRRQIALTGAAIPANSYCTVTLNTTSSTIGTYPNTTGAVTAHINGSAVGTDTANATLTVTAAHPGISILKQVSLTGSDPWTSFVPLPVGGSVYFRFIVENTGDVALNTVTVTDPALNPVSPYTLAGCSWANLPLYDVQTCTFGPVTNVTAGDHTNTATALGYYEGTEYADIDSARYATTGLTITKNVAESYFAAAGDSLHYSYVVRNTGWAPLLGPVTVADDKVGAVSCQAVSAVGDNDNYLDRGEQVACPDSGTVPYTIQGTDATIGFVTNSATATVSGVTSSPATKTVYLAALTIDKDTSTPNVTAGGTASYSIVVRNTGGVPLTNVVISDALPGGFTYASTGAIIESGAGTTRTSTNDPAAGDPIPSWGTWTIAPGGSVTIPFTVNFDAGVDAGTYDNTASVVSTQIPGPTDDDGSLANDPGTPDYGKSPMPDPSADPETDEDVTVNPAVPEIRLTKSADPTSVPETGGNVTFTFLVENLGGEEVTLTSLTDSVFGDLKGKGDCSVPQSIPAGGSYSCDYTVFLSSDDLADHHNVATGTASDDDGNSDTATDDETVTFNDVLPDITITKTANPTSVPETGGDVTFTFRVINNGTEVATISSLSDSVYGALAGDTDCQVGTVLAVDAYCEFSSTPWVAGDYSSEAHYNVFTVQATDNDGNEDSATDDETVTFTDVAPDITITKTADPTSVPETGGDVTFTFLVENIGQEDVTLTSLSDSVFGDLDGLGTCNLPQTIPMGGSYSCEYTVFLIPDNLSEHYNVVTAVSEDNDGSTDTASDDETVIFNDMPPEITVTKTADPTLVTEPGGMVTFSITIMNNSGPDDPVTITSLMDNIHGDLNEPGTCSMPQTIQPGESYACQFTAYVEGAAGQTETDVVTAIGHDDEGAPVEDSDDAEVSIVPGEGIPVIDLQKDASPTRLPEPGGVVTFTVTITNNSSPDDPVTITSLVDDIHGDLNGQGTCSVPQTLQPGKVYTCEFTALFEGESGKSETDIVTAEGIDDDGQFMEDSDDATVQIGLYRLYLPLLGKRPEITTSLQITLGYEDLSLVKGDNDFDYNDWVTTINTELEVDAVNQFLYGIEFTFIPQARGGIRSHTPHIMIPANSFASDGVATLTIYDRTGNSISSEQLTFIASQDNDFAILDCTCDAFPKEGHIINAFEERHYEPTNRTSRLEIQFNTPGPFNLNYLSQDQISFPHGEGLFFDPYLVVHDHDVVHRGDPRLLSIPDINFDWPEEEVRIDTVYPLVEGDSPYFTFADRWWTQHNTCVYGDGIKCALSPDMESYIPR